MDDRKKIIAHLSGEKLFKPHLPLLRFDHKPSSLPLSEHLIVSIISQQLSTKAADTIVGRVYQLFEPHGFTLKKLMETDDDVLRAAGMSRAKVLYVKNTAAYFLEQEAADVNWTNLSDEEIIERLTSIKGVGLWTVQMILIFNLHRPDVFALGDLIVRKKLLELAGLEEDSKRNRDKLWEMSEQWSPYRSYVSRLMWRINDAGRM